VFRHDAGVTHCSTDGCIDEKMVTELEESGRTVFNDG
jgi:hypothetical protein